MNIEQQEIVPTGPVEHLLTPANIMTASRPLIAGYIAYKLLNEEVGVTPLMVAMAASDAEGNVARAIDRFIPDSGYGCTEIGKSLDPIADTAAFMEVAAAALKAPRVSKLGKAAVGIVLMTEAVKTGWAVSADSRYRRKTGEKLVIAPTKTGKLATAEKFVALTAAVATHDLEPGPRRTAAGIVALGAALLGAFHGENARRGYQHELTDL